MKIVKTVLTLLLILAAQHAQSDDAEDAGDSTRFLSVRCEYQDEKTFKSERVHIEYNRNAAGERAGRKSFRPVQESQQVIYQVKPGEVAECIFPSGNSVRAKVGEGQGRPFGMCGADPKIFTSIWVNKRKVASREWFTGHCKQDNGEPEVSFDFYTIYPDQLAIKKCMTQMPKSSIKGASSSDQPLSVCIKYPDLSLLPIDPLEYPAKGQESSPVGEVKLVGGTEKVCDVLLDKLKQSFHIENYPYYSYGWGLPQLPGPEWASPSMRLPDELRSSEESIFDFDNDGTLDRVVTSFKESHYMHGNVILVQRGSSAKALRVKGELIGKGSWYLPCQLDEAPHSMEDCAPFSSKTDEATLLVKPHGSKRSVAFRSRYSVLVPFYFQDKNYLRVESIAENADSFVAVLRPMPNKKTEAICLFERTEENF